MCKLSQLILGFHMTSRGHCMGPAAILVYHELISICQIQCFERKNACNNNTMSRTNLDEKSDFSVDNDNRHIPLLSEYATSLEKHVKQRYLEKISTIRVDPFTLLDARLDSECLPPVEATDLLCYLVLETSYYTSVQFKAFKSLEAYNQIVSGFITSVQGKKIAEKYVVLSKVRQSQRMNEAPIPIWIIADEEGTVISAHCMGCKAGLAESCSHTASVLFYIEAWTRIRGKLSCTQVKCTWLLPTYVNEVPYARARDINFKSAQKIKAELAHVCLKDINPLIQGFQRTTLGPVRNFDVMSSEFVQILHTGSDHWVCVSSVGCIPGEVNLYDSLFHDIIEKEVEEQVKDLMADSFVGVNNVPVQQQPNGSDCGVFAIAFATCIVYGRDPQEETFIVSKMRPHLLNCLQNGKITLFPEM